MRHTRHRADANHWPALAALKAVTFAMDVHNFGGGVGDILARHVKTGAPMFIEMKDGEKPPSKRKLTDSETWFAVAFPDNAVVCLSVEDALRAVGALL